MSCELQQTSTIDKDRLKVEVSIDISTWTDQQVKAVNVKEYIPEELFKNTNDGIFTGFGLMWQAGIVNGKETLTYTLILPEVTEPTTYELRTVVEYQTYDDFMLLEKTHYLTVTPGGQVRIKEQARIKTRHLTVTPEGQVRIEEGKEALSVKGEGKGYDKVYWASPNFRGGDAGNVNGNNKGNNGKSGDNGNDKGNNGKGNDGDNGKGNGNNGKGNDGDNGKGNGKDK